MNKVELSSLAENRGSDIELSERLKSEILSAGILDFEKQFVVFDLIDKVIGGN